MGLSFANLQKFLMKGLMPTLRALPPRRALKLVTEMGRVEYSLNPYRRITYAPAVRRCAEYFGADWDEHRTARELAANQFRWRARDILLDRLSNEQAEALLHVTGREHLDEAYNRKQGVILLFNHFGGFLMPAHWLVRYGYPLRWFTERPRQISKLVSRDFGEDGPLGQRGLFISRRLTPKEGSTAIRGAVRVVQAGMIVQLAGDVRWSGSRTAPGTFLGRNYQFTTTWIHLAAMTARAVVQAYCVMNADGSYDLEFLEPFSVPADVPRKNAYAPFVQKNLDAIEERIKIHPENSLDYFFWTESDRWTADPQAA